MNSKPTVMYVEDDPEAGRTLAAILAHYGYTPIHFTDPEEALKAYAENYPALAIVDVMLPKMDGFTLGAKLRAIKELPILYITAFPSQEVQERLEREKLTCLIKPFQPFQLKEKVEALLS